MRTRKRPVSRAPSVPYAPPAPTPETVALGQALDEVFASMQLLVNLELMTRARAIGLFHKVDFSRNTSHLSCEVCTEGREDVLGSFTVGTRMEAGKVSLRIHVSTTFCDEYTIADTRFKALTAIMEVARMLQKTYVETWSFSSR